MSSATRRAAAALGGLRGAPAWRWDQIAVASIIAGATLRVLWVFAFHPPPDHVYSDMGGYVGRAVKLAAGGGFDRYDAFYPPGTHLLLALPLALFGTDRTGLVVASALWCALSALTPYWMWRFARTHLTPAGAGLTAALTALWPMHISYAGYFLSETPALAFLAASLAYTCRASEPGGRSRRGALAGVLGGIAAANRPALALNLVVSAVHLVRRGRTHGASVTLLAGSAALMLALVVAHNSLAAGKPTFLSENGGLTFFLGHCDVLEVRTGRPGGPQFHFGAPPAIQRGSGMGYEFPDRVVWEQDFFIAEGLACVRQDGLGHLRTLLRGPVDMTLTSKPWPQVVEDTHGDVINVTNVMYSAALPFIVVGAITLARRRHARSEPAPETLLLAHLACVLATAVIFFGDPRFRTPYDVFGLALLASFVADAIFDPRPARRG